MSSGEDISLFVYANMSGRIRWTTTLLLIGNYFVENRYDFDDRENWKGAYCIIRN